jgi:hypothetical protein
MVLVGLESGQIQGSYPTSFNLNSGNVKLKFRSMLCLSYAGQK